MKNKTINMIPLVVALTLTGCVSVPHLEENNKIINKDININNPYRISALKPASVVGEKWWEQIGDKQLNQLMDAVLKNNDDMKIALLNIEKTKINVDLARSAQVPSLGLDASIQRQKFSESGLTPPPYGGSSINFAQVAISSSYDFDLFGKYDGMIKEQDYTLRGLELKRDYLVLSLSNQVVKQYGYWQYLKLQESNLEKQLDLESQNVLLQQKRVELGKGVPQDLLAQENNVKTIEVQLKQNQQNLKETENNIQVLAGTFDLQNISQNLNVLQYTLPEIESVKADTVSKRPDVAYYLAMINAQQSKLSSLKADFYPSISISGEVGFQKIGLTDIFSMKNIFGNFGPAIHLPILDSGRIKGTYKVAGVDANIFVQEYNQAVLKSFYDINTQLYNYKNSKEILSQQENIFNNQKKDYLYNEQQWNLGNISRLNWNTYQQKQLREQLDYVSNKFTYFNAQMNLINSLGGIVEND